MRPPERWPLHPAPAATESLSSWLRRTASSYGMYSHQLLEHALGHRELSDAELDLDPPRDLLDELAKRTGLDQHRVQAMTMAGWVPWLFDSLAPAPDAYATYVHQFSVLLPPTRRQIYTPRKWLPWLAETRVLRGCRECLKSGPTILLFWQLPLMASCPVHRHRLETYEGHPADYIKWTTSAEDQREFPDPLFLMDRRTWQAIATGSVDLPRRSVHAGVWFRLLRTLLDELSTAQGRYGRQLEDVRRVWDHCGHPFRAGLHSWQPFETLHWTRQLQLLKAAATAMEMIEDGTLTVLGTSGHLLRPEPKTPISSGTPPGPLTAGADTHQPTLDELWNTVTTTLDACIAAAKTDPVVAKHLFDFARYGCRSEEFVGGLKDAFAELQIPLEFLSQTE
ncbi:TniQ family protein (plasmid) [Paenarthrobacter ureafaciens]|uniref:TniQ family protein n=1 Tax=Paenarthrobacter sp. PAE-2 TaxID=2982532 RepID=UPI002232B94C|nr:TniQ family protein [Paenarthrobacter sp. PAE-2]MCW3768543.1 TniQ family protein [Paenarthrobacter sp. PAE-2]